MENNSNQSGDKPLGGGEHVNYFERLVYTNLHGNTFAQGGHADQAGHSPEGAMGAWEYWGNGHYCETGPDGSYTGGDWYSEA